MRIIQMFKLILSHCVPHESEISCVSSNKRSVFVYPHLREMQLSCWPESKIENSDQINYRVRIYILYSPAHMRSFSQVFCPDWWRSTFRRQRLIRHRPENKLNQPSENTTQSLFFRFVKISPEPTNKQINNDNICLLTTSRIVTWVPCSLICSH